MVQTGLEQLTAAPPARIFGQRLGLLCNPASADREFCHARDLIHKRFPGQLRALYSPQHGFFAEKQDNMIESDHTADPALHIPVFSLYGETRIPTAEMFDPIDTLIIDLQDAGTRVYTFIYTASYCLEAAKKYGKKSSGAGSSQSCGRDRGGRELSVSGIRLVCRAISHSHASRPHGRGNSEIIQ